MRSRLASKTTVAVSAFVLIGISGLIASSAQASMSQADPSVPVVQSPVTSTVPGATTPNPSTPSAQSIGRRAVLNVTIGSLQDNNFKVSGSGWPAGQPVTLQVCGNSFRNGTVDCSKDQAQTVPSSTGDFIQAITLTRPPSPCPCVVHVATFADPIAIDLPFDFVGIPTATPSTTTTTRSIDVNASISGSGPFSAYLGGAAKRELLLSVTNTGSQPLVNPSLNLFVGRGEDPADPLVSPEGGQPNLGTIAPGATVEYRQPVTIGAPAFGQYRVKGEFSGLDSITVDQVQNAQGDLSFSVATSSYPWVLIIVAWLLLQIPLLGLYKRRPVAQLPTDEDSLIEQLPVADGNAGFAAGMFDQPIAVGATAAAVAAPAAQMARSATAPPPPPPGYRAVLPAGQVFAAPVVATVAPVAASASGLPPMPAPAVGVSAAPVATPAPTGVEALRALLQPPQQ